MERTAMSKDEARELLLLFRPGTADDNDPEFAAAMEFARSDSELNAWFEQHCAFQSAALDSFDTLHAPAGLREQIVSERPAPLDASRHNGRFAILAVAAALVVAAVVTGIWLTWAPASQNAFNLFRNRMVGDVQRSYPRMDLLTSNKTEVKTYLREHGYGGYQLPAVLAKTTVTGCKLMRWHDKPVGMICFNSGRRGDARTPDLFLFVIHRADLKTAPEQVQFSDVGNLSTASWAQGENVYVLALDGNENLLKTFL
jgi:hypothetical protein